MLTIFDCDGVLVDSELIAAEAMANLLQAEGFDVEARNLLQFVGMKQADILAGVARLAGKPVPARAPEKLWSETRRLFAERLMPMAGAAAFIGTLQGARCVASSSHHERIRFSLETTGLHRFFSPHIFSSTEVENGKPAPDLFLHAARRMNADPAKAIVIEDSIAGVTGARAAGMRVIGFIGGAHSDSAMGERLMAAGAHSIAESFADVAAFMRGN